MKKNEITPTDGEIVCSWIEKINIVKMTWASLVAQMVKKKKKNLLTVQEPRLNPWVRKISGRSEWLPTPVFLPGESHVQRSQVGSSPWDCKELDMTEQLSVHTCTQGNL